MDRDGPPQANGGFLKDSAASRTDHLAQLLSRYDDSVPNLALSCRAAGRQSRRAFGVKSGRQKLDRSRQLLTQLGTSSLATIALRKAHRMAVGRRTQWDVKESRRGDERTHSALMPAVRITLPTSLVLSPKNSPNSAGRREGGVEAALARSGDFELISSFKSGRILDGRRGTYVRSGCP